MATPTTDVGVAAATGDGRGGDRAGRSSEGPSHAHDEQTLKADAAGTTIGLSGNRMLNQRTPLFDTCAVLVTVAIIGAIGAQRPQILAIGAPFLVLLTLAVALFEAPQGEVQLFTSAQRVTEGDLVAIDLEFRNGHALHRVEAELTLDDRLTPLSPPRVVLRVDNDSPRRVRVIARADAWGVAPIEQLHLRITNRFGLFGGRVHFELDDAIRVGLPADQRRASMPANRFRSIVGSHLSGDRGDGQEIADIRPWQPGDPHRQINWRITNRRQEPWVTLRHPDRSTTVIIVVDAHEGEDDSQRATQRRSVEAAMALSRSHLDQHDRVGLLVVGHTLAWRPPGLGRTQQWAIGDALVAVGNAPEASLRRYQPPAVSSIPSNAIVVAVSPLRDPRMVTLVAELLSRGNPVSVLMPALASEKRRRPASFRSTLDATAERAAEVEQRIGITSLQRRGAVLVEWPEGQPVESVMAAAGHLQARSARAR